ncbi:MAG: hypothetical protein FJ308_15910 [Planctomycetes bacterium]|nr:hypothetical protein [Planctomycetota bacterium]
MKTYEVDSTYRQLYVADIELAPSAPEDWNEEPVQQRHYALDHIVALSPVGDIVARVTSFGPRDPVDETDDRADFEIETEIDIPSGKIGVYGWPCELQDSYTMVPGKAKIRFRGFRTSDADNGLDYYIIEIKEAEPSDARQALGRPF